ncbi:hypothetical protein LCGC14_2448550, partial [marine sediment metagenome]
TPVGALVAAPKYADVLGPGTHGCTMGGNPLCAAAGVATMKLIHDQGLLEAARTKGAAIVDAVTSAGISKVKQVRGKGLMIGIELDCPGKEVYSACLERGLIVNCTQDTVVRLAPPLIVSEDDLHQGLEILIEVLKAG